MIKRLFMLTAVLSLAGGAAFAYFSATADSDSNTITAGTLVFGSPQDNFYDISNVAPGDEITGTVEGSGGVTAGYDYNIGNAGTISANHVEVTVTNTPSDLANPMDVKMVVSTLSYQPRGGGAAINLKNLIESNPNLSQVTAGTDNAYLIRTENNTNFSNLLDNGILTLNSLENSGQAILEIADNTNVIGVPAGLAAGTDADFDLDLTFDSAAGNEYQNDSVDTTLTFTLNQHSSQ